MIWLFACVNLLFAHFANASALLAQNSTGPRTMGGHALNLLLFVIVVVVLVVIVYHTRKYFTQEDDTSPGGMVGFSLKDLNEMNADGRLEPEEYARLKAMVVAQAREAYLADPKADDDADRPSRGRASLASGNDLATHGLLSDAASADAPLPPPEESAEPIDLAGDEDEEREDDGDKGDAGDAHDPYKPYTPEPPHKPRG